MKQLTEMQKKGIRRRLALFERKRLEREKRAPRSRMSSWGGGAGQRRRPAYRTKQVKFRSVATRSSDRAHGQDMFLGHRLHANRNGGRNPVSMKQAIRETFHQIIKEIPIAPGHAGADWWIAQAVYGIGEGWDDILYSDLSEEEADMLKKNLGKELDSGMAAARQARQSAKIS